MATTERNSATRTFTDVCILGATVRTTGFCGGDGGHAGITEFILEDLGGTNIQASFTEDEETRIKITVRGDAELRVLVQALRFGAEALEALCHVSRDAAVMDCE